MPASFEAKESQISSASSSGGIPTPSRMVNPAVFEVPSFWCPILNPDAIPNVPAGAQIATTGESGVVRFGVPPLNVTLR